MKNLLLSVIGALLIPVAALAQSDGGGRLAGTWDANVTIRNCATGNAIVSFLSTASFNRGGTYSGITSGTPPAVRSSERGVWSHISGNLYRFRFKAYLFNATGQATGYQVITHDLELDKDDFNYTSEGISETFTLGGMLTATGCSTAVGTRMTLD